MASQSPKVSHLISGRQQFQRHLSQIFDMSAINEPNNFINRLVVKVLDLTNIARSFHGIMTQHGTKNRGSGEQYVLVDFNIPASHANRKIRKFLVFKQACKVFSHFSFRIKADFWGLYFWWVC